MNFTPPRRLGLALGGLFLLLLLATIALSLDRLARASISAWLILWVALPLAGVPLALIVGYRIYGLATARYVLDRNGFSLTWGLAREQIPLASLAPPARAPGEARLLRPKGGLWWPGCVVGKRVVEGLGTVEFFAASAAAGIVLLRFEERILAISPPDPEAFLQMFTDAARMGSLEQVPAVSLRPDFLSNRIWTDPAARLMVVGGLALPLLLLAYLAVRAPSLPSDVPFGFNPEGGLAPLAPAGRLLLLPLIGGLCWLANVVIGSWLYRQPADRPLSYAMWGTAVAASILLWGAALQLLTAAHANPGP